MLRRLLLLVCSCTLAACASGAGPLRRDSAPAAEAARTAAARADLLRALRSGDRLATGRLLAPDAILRLPDGTVARGGEAVLDALHRVVALAADHPLVFDLARTRACTAALHDVGMLLAGSGAAPGTGWHAVLLWRESGAGGALRLHEIALHAADDFSAYRARPCLPLPDSVFGERRWTLLLEPGLGGVESHRHVRRIDAQLEAAGWREWPLLEKHDSRRPVLAGAGLRAELRPGIFAAARGRLSSGRAERWHPDFRSQVTLDYDLLQGNLQAGYARGWLYASAGPAALRAAGSWVTSTTVEGEPRHEPLDWNAWAVGAVAEGGLLVPLAPRFALGIGLEYRYFPDLEIPGYRGSPATRVSFTNLGAAASMGLRF